MNRPGTWADFADGLRRQGVTVKVRLTRVLDRHGRPLKLVYLDKHDHHAVTPWMHPEEYPEDSLIESICSRLGIDPSIFGVNPPQ